MFSCHYNWNSFTHNNPLNSLSNTLLSFIFYSWKWKKTIRHCQYLNQIVCTVNSWSYLVMKTSFQQLCNLNFNGKLMHSLPAVLVWLTAAISDQCECTAARPEFVCYSSLSDIPWENLYRFWAVSGPPSLTTTNWMLWSLYLLYTMGKSCRRSSKGRIILPVAYREQNMEIH